MRRLASTAGGLVVIGAIALAAEQSPSTPALADVLQRAGERVERYLVRAQSIVCLELVSLQSLTAGWTREDTARTVESELRLSWQPTAEGLPSTEARTLRELLRVNGHKPRSDDWRNCTAPEQQAHEPQPLSLLLSGQRADYHFSLDGTDRVDGRPAILVDYRLLKPASVEAHMVEGREDCVSFNVEGGMRGRIWIDASTYDVLRLDQSLSGMLEIPLPRRATRHTDSPSHWTMDRWDTSIRFKAVSFSDPEETLVLPASMISLRVTRGSGSPRLRTTTDYKNYRRFLTGARVVGER
jgi:hypothetical protein